MAFKIYIQLQRSPHHRPDGPATKIVSKELFGEYSTLEEAERAFVQLVKGRLYSTESGRAEKANVHCAGGWEVEK
jgi:hypothetical protein